MGNFESNAPAHVRRLILAAAFATGLAVALAPRTASVRAADLAVQIEQAATPPGKAATTPAMPQESAKTESKKPDATDANDDDGDESSDASSGGAKARGDVHGIVIEKGGKKIRIEGLGQDREYDSFRQFVQDAPWVAGAFFLTLLLLFLVPLLVMVLLIWYKMRKHRLASETMLKLAERGVVPPATAMEAVAAGNAPASVAAAGAAMQAAAAAATPAYERARFVHRRAVWSDLRRGVLLTAAGLALSFWSMIEDGSANSVGLVLLFVGLGYCIIWFFEDRTSPPPGSPPPGSP